ncbi:AraC family transcriptional regulator [Paenibacillus protaetiae]|uniref:Helix-turn-helix domain-containing protein n=1 Tax=Paenibacillus protaetiae TaxID=2509456 RepID=A0A4P6EVU7_9BACL|nr:AraC family transcriptional regulator [Paenibacillus protaetiae]QAY65819.1 helix-turn-helix domain-containing protein [Paenibacillus protaetiae]
MKEKLPLAPAVLTLLYAFQRTEGHKSWPCRPSNAGLDILLIATKSSAARIEAGKAYFICGEFTAHDWEFEQIEGFLFLFQQQETDGRFEALALPILEPYIKLCENIASHFNAKEDLERFRGHVYFQELLYELYRLREQWKLNTRTAVEHTRLYMLNNYAEEMTVEELASMAGISPAYYMEVFKKLAGKSPIDYLTSVRINAAKKLLDGTKAPAYQVAESVGYKDPFYFSRQFKRVTGMAPSRYARRSSLRVAALHYPMTGHMLALQHIPYAAPLDREFCQFYKQKYELHIPVHLRDPAVDTNMMFNLNALKEAEPDIVISGDWLSETNKSELNQMATTLYVPWWEKDWRDHLLIVGGFLGCMPKPSNGLTNTTGERLSSVSGYKNA